MTHWRKRSTQVHIHGLDMYGNPVTEIIDVPDSTFRQRIPWFIVRILGWRLSVILGITGWKYVSGIKVVDHAKPKEK